LCRPVSVAEAEPGPGIGRAAAQAPPAERARRGFWHELPVLVVVALVLALLIKAFLIQAFFIPSGSMEQTLHGCRGCVGDRVLVNKLLYDVRDIRRGEIVVFNGEGSWGANSEATPGPAGNPLQRLLRGAARAVGAAPPGDKDYVKRVIGIPGDRVACCTPDGQVTVQPEDQDVPVALEEPYVFEDDRQPFCAAGAGSAACPTGAEGVLVPDGRLWVMGDHRSASGDSRAYLDGPGQGTIPQDKVIGRAFVIVWPPNRARFLNVPRTFDP
jgi:signal peptidase I